MRYLCCRYCVAERVIGIFLSTSQRRISHSLSLDSSPPISGCSSEPTPSFPYSAEWRLPRSIGVSHPPRVSGEIYTHPRIRPHVHTHTYTQAHTSAYLPRVREFSLCWKDEEVSIFYPAERSQEYRWRARDKCEQALSEYLPVRAERICVQICIGCPVFSLPEFGSSWFFLPEKPLLLLIYRCDSAMRCPLVFISLFSSTNWPNQMRRYYNPI